MSTVYARKSQATVGDLAGDAGHFAQSAHLTSDLSGAQRALTEPAVMALACGARQDRTAPTIMSLSAPPRRHVVSPIGTAFKPGAKRAHSLAQFATTLVGALTRKGASEGSSHLAWQISARLPQRHAR